MPDYTFTDDMAEISGFGGTYEACCRAMVVAGLKFWDAQPQAFNPEFRGYQNVYGVISEENADAKALTKAVLDAPMLIDGKSATVGEYGATGAMHQATITAILWIRRNGWEKYCSEMRKHRAEKESR